MIAKAQYHALRHLHLFASAHRWTGPVRLRRELVAVLTEAILPIMASQAAHGRTVIGIAADHAAEIIEAHLRHDHERTLRRARAK